MLIPKKEIVKFILKDVLRRQRIKSQARLAEVVGKKLKQGDRQYRISAQRARIIATETPGVRVRIKTRKGKLPKKCPACNHKLKKVYTKNLRGRKVLVALRCSKCNYRGSGNKWVPSMYEFELKASD